MHIFTIGNARLATERFVHLLKANGIDSVVDVRAVPSDPYRPQFDAKTLRSTLAEHDIKYLDFSAEFIACSTDPEADYALVTATPQFRHGVERIALGTQRGFRIAIMATEADPTRCHRFTFIARYLASQCFDVSHIMPDGSICSHESLTATAEPQAAATTTAATPLLVFIDAVMLAVRLGKVQHTEQKEALLVAARAATSPLTFMNAAENFGIASRTSLHDFLGQFMAAPAFYRDRHAAMLGIPEPGGQPQPFLDNKRAIDLVEPLLTPHQCRLFSELYWWFSSNHRQHYFDSRKRELRMGAYATAPKDNASVLTRFAEYLRRLAGSTKATVRKRYEDMPFDIIIDLETRTFMPQRR